MKLIVGEYRGDEQGGGVWKDDWTSGKMDGGGWMGSGRMDGPPGVW